MLSPPGPNPARYHLPWQRYRGLIHLTFAPLCQVSSSQTCRIRPKLRCKARLQPSRKVKASHRSLRRRPIPPPEHLSQARAISRIKFRHRARLRRSSGSEWRNRRSSSALPVHARRHSSIRLRSGEFRAGSLLARRRVPRIMQGRRPRRDSTHRRNVQVRACTGPLQGGMTTRKDIMT